MTAKAHAARLFPGRDFKSTAQRLRPHICPFDALVERVPEGARVLDVGCGAGLFLGLLAMSGRLHEGVGFDADDAAIARAEAMAKAAGLQATLDLRAIGVDAPWPEGPFDVVSMIDVMHHVPRASRPGIYDAVATRLRSGGLFVYKDMVDAPAWKALGNRFHDLVLARDWIAYEPVEAVEAACAERGLSLVSAQDETRLWYGHELRVFMKG